MAGLTGVRPFSFWGCASGRDCQVLDCIVRAQTGSLEWLVMTKTFTRDGDQFWIEGKPVSQERWEAEFALQREEEEADDAEEEGELDDDAVSDD